jgi:hypothetical protein
MPYDTSIEKLRLLVTRTLDTEDFAKRAEEAGISKERLVTLLSRDPEIWSPAESKRLQLERLEKEFTVRREHRKHRVELLKVIPLATGTTVLMFYLMFRYGSPEPGALAVLPYWLVPALAVVGFGLTYGYYLLKRKRFNESEYSFRWELEQEEEFAALKKKIEAAQAKVDDVIIAQGLKTRIREILDNLLAVPFNTQLPKLDYAGLSDVFNSANEIATDAKRELEFMLTTMPGGSIGIAGPRGSGKSTLLKSACADRPGNLEEHKLIPVFTTSPVEYEGRDFILHLFSTVCNKLLEITTDKKRGPDAIDGIAREHARKRHSVLRRLAPLTLMLGGFLLAVSILAAFVNVVFEAGPAPQPPPAQSQTAAPPAQAQPTAQPQSSPTPRPASTRFIQALGFNPAPFFTSGVLLLLFFYVVSRVFRRELQKDSPVQSRVQTLKLDEESRRNLEKIGEDARLWLKEIKFQQSFTSGWSGALKLPVGLEGGINSAVSLAQQQLSLPDITQGFSDFLGAIASDFKVIIGIDELDKLESDEAAQRFLNEIKAVFGLPNVFYLISVSENAMSNFERRGLPFRDVFDSSFDNIVYVEYLRLEHAKRLIARRVLAMPPPFVHLCYCISGGLARDLVRTCRNLMQHAHKIYELDEHGTDSNLKNLSAALIESDLRLKLHALVVVAKKLSPDNRVSAFLERLHSLENNLTSTGSLLEAYEGLIRETQPAATKTAETNGAAGLIEVYDKLKQRLAGEVPDLSNAKALRSLHDELASYLYYCVTILEFFSEVINPALFARAEQEKAFDELARARQYLAINPAVTRKIIDKFRVSFGMTVPNTSPAPAAVN